LAGDEVRRLLEALVPVTVGDNVPAGQTGLRVVSGTLEATLFVAGSSDDRQRLLRQRDETRRQVEVLRAKLANPGFVEQAPAPVVEKARQNLREAEARLQILERILGEEGH
jgi:valyl-tRNA synthetase